MFYLFLLQGKCYQCNGTIDDCGFYLTSQAIAHNNIQLIDCGTNDCWASRTEINKEVTFSRGCSVEMCTSYFTNENCQEANGRKQCKQCCKGEKCNNWFLDGKGAANSIQFLTVLHIFLLLFAYSMSFNNFL